MFEQLDMFGPGVFVVPKPDAYDPTTDMAFQPALCETCGAQYFRAGAYLICKTNPAHWRFVECCGRPDHPQHDAFVRYRHQVGHPIE